MSPDLIAIALSTAFTGILIYRFANIVIRLENTMANSSAKLASLHAAALKAIADRDTEIASLKAQIAAVDPTASADLQADETEINNFEAGLAAAGVTPAPVVTETPAA